MVHTNAASVAAAQACFIGIVRYDRAAVIHGISNFLNGTGRPLYDLPILQEVWNKTVSIECAIFPSLVANPGRGDILREVLRRAFGRQNALLSAGYTDLSAQVALVFCAIFVEKGSGWRHGVALVILLLLQVQIRGCLQFQGENENHMP